MSETRLGSRWVLSIVCVGLALAALSGGCTDDWLAAFSLTDDIMDDSPTVNDNGSTGLAPAENVITIRFQNLTSSEAVNVQLHASQDSLTTVPDDLFVDEHKLTSGVGFAGTGLIPPRSGDLVELPCTDDLIVGTLGGEFVDSDTGELLGVGQPRWAQAGPLGMCGSILTFEFAGSDGSYTTSVRLSD